MSCLENNPCTQTPCGDPCDPNPCQDNCGCLNPTSFACISKPGVHTVLGITNDMNGEEVLAAINSAVANIVPGDGSPAADVYVKVTSGDTTTGYLATKFIDGKYTKVTVVNPGGNEKLKVDVVPSSLVSTNAGNLLDLGTDGKFRVLGAGSGASATYISDGTGTTVTGTGTASDPFIININPSISVTRSCFDGVWRNIPIIPTGNSNVVFVSGTPKYRYRFDGSIEFKGSATYSVTFGDYSTGDRKQTITFGSLPITCLTSPEQSGTSDLKSVSYIDTPQASADEITQQYNYIIRKNGTAIILEFQSSFSATTTKSIVVNFDGAISHPNI